MNINEKWAGLSELLELTDYLSVERTEDSLSHVLSNGDVIQWGGEYIPVINKEDFNKVFNRHWEVYINENPYSDKQTYIEITIKKLVDLLKKIDCFFETIKDNESLESYLNHPQYLRCKAYIKFLNEYKVGKWDNLYIYLTNTKYIDTTIEVFNSVMEYKNLPSGANKVKWLTTHADAIYFQEIFQFLMTQFNECFRSKTGTKFQLGSKSTTKRKKNLTYVITFLKE